MRLQYYYISHCVLQICNFQNNGYKTINRLIKLYTNFYFRVFSCNVRFLVTLLATLYFCVQANLFKYLREKHEFCRYTYFFIYLPEKKKKEYKKIFFRYKKKQNKT